MRKTEWIKFPNQDNIRTLREKDDYKNLGILGTNNVKQSEVEEKKEKTTSEEQEKFSKPISAAEILAKE